MQVNSNAITSTASRPVFNAVWRHAFIGAWQADWRERRRDWRVWLVLAIGLVLAACAALLASLDLERTRAARAAAAEAEAGRWVHQGSKNPHSAAHYGVYVFKPLTTLAALDPGIEHYVGASVWLEAHRQNDMVYRPAADGAGAERQFRLSPALMLQVLAPAAMIFLGFGMFAAERERGMLPALRLSGAPLGAIAAARGAVLLCLALTMSFPAIVAIAGMKWHAGGAEPVPDAAVRGLLFAAGYLVYLATWATLVTAVSAVTRTMRASLALLVTLWTVATLVLPRAALELAQSAAPLPSMQAFRQALDEELGMPDDPAEAERHKQQLLGQYGVDEVADLPVNWSGISQLRSEAHGNKVFDRHYGPLFAAMAAQDRAVALAGWLSPAVAMGGLSSRLAASDHASHADFMVAAEAHRRLMQDLLNSDLARNPDRDGVKYLAGEALWRSIPPFRFTYAALDMGELLARWLLPLSAGLAASLTLAAGALRRLRTGSVK
jgi:ABC-2 type transport system permease protein